MIGAVRATQARDGSRGQERHICRNECETCVQHLHTAFGRIRLPPRLGKENHGARGATEQEQRGLVRPGRRLPDIVLAEFVVEGPPADAEEIGRPLAVVLRDGKRTHDHLALDLGQWCAYLEGHFR